MRRISFWLLSTVTALVLMFGYHTSTSGPLATSAQTSIEATLSTGSSSTKSSSSDTSSSSTGSSGSSGSSGNTTTKQTTATTVAGGVAQTQWGPVQVQLTVEGGVITQVSVLQYPSGNGRDAEINSYALPILTQETLDAQSASIDMVSGATVTSEGYLASLQSAIDQASL